MEWILLSCIYFLAMKLAVITNSGIQNGAKCADCRQLFKVFKTAPYSNHYIDLHQIKSMI